MIYKILGIFTAGAPKVLIYAIKQYYSFGKVSIRSIKKIYVRSFILSHVKWLVYITCLPFIYPYICDFFHSIPSLFAPILALLINIGNVFDMNHARLSVMPNTTTTTTAPTPSFNMQLSTLCHYINFYLDRLHHIGYRFEQQFEMARASGNPEDIIRARMTKNEISKLREDLVSKISERESIAKAALALHPRGKFNDYTFIPNYDGTSMDMAYTYLNAKEWKI